MSHICSDPGHPEMGVKFGDGKKEFKALVISPSALSALSRKEGSAQWELFRASQLTWLVQHAALMNDTLSWKPREKNFLPPGDTHVPESRRAAPRGRLPQTHGCPGTCGWVVESGPQVAPSWEEPHFLGANHAHDGVCGSGLQPLTPAVLSAG